MLNNLEPGSEVENLRILSLDGGGIRGIAVARILQEIEEHFQQPIHELFDLVIGTSTGGLLSMMLTIPSRNGEIMTAEAAKDLYIANGTEIFKCSYERELEFWGTKYAQTGLVNIIAGMFDDNTTLKDAVTNVGVVCTDEVHSKSIVLNSFRAIKYPDDYRHGAKLSDIACSTTAAPTYFDHVTLQEVAKSFIEPVCDESNEWFVIDKENDKKEDALNESIEWYTLESPKYKRKNLMLEDGGTTNNNPAYLGLKLVKHVLKEKQVKAKNIQVISVGTGSLSGNEDDPEETQPFWNKVGSGIPGIFERELLHDPFRIGIKSYQVHRKVLDYFRERKMDENYVRVQFKIDDHQYNCFDDCSTKNVSNLIASAESYLYQNSTGGASAKEHSEAFKKLIGVMEASNPNRAKSTSRSKISKISTPIKTQCQTSIEVSKSETFVQLENEQCVQIEQTILKTEEMNASSLTPTKLASVLKSFISSPVQMLRSIRK